MNLAVVAETPVGPHAWFTPVHLGPAPAVASVRLRSRVAAGPATSAALAHPKTRACVYFLRSSTEGTTRIGELHVSRVGHGEMTGHYESRYTADSTSSVGASGTGDPGSFGAQGNVTLTNSISGRGGFPHRGGYGQYVNGHIYYGKYQGEGTFCVANWLIEENSVVGDAFPGPRQAPPNPSGNCHQDPSGYATVPSHGGWWEADGSVALTYSGAFSWFGFGFSESNGFTHDIRETWHNGGSITTYVCGNKRPIGTSSVFYNENP